MILQTIIGSRYRCTVCFDFDFCFKCYKHRTETHEPTHDFRVAEGRWEANNYTRAGDEVESDSDESSLESIY